MALTLIGTPLVLTTDDTALCEYDITSGIDGTYDSYEFHFVNMHPATDNVVFSFQVNASNDLASGGGEFDTSLITSTLFRASHNETGTDATILEYVPSAALAQQALFQPLGYYTGFDDDQSVSGVLTLYDPSSTTYVKHFTSTANAVHANNHSMVGHVAGYINQALAIPEIRFKFSSGNIDAGTIKMFGVS
jgi:hypothetical protein